MVEVAKPSPPTVLPSIPEKKLKGSISVMVYPGEIVVTFEGDIRGRDVDLIMRQLMKQYRVWMHKLSKERK